MSEDESSKITQYQINQLTNTFINSEAEKGKTRSPKSAHKQKSGFDALMALIPKVSGQNDKIMNKMEKMEKFILSVTPKLQCMEDQIHDLQDKNESLKAVHKHLRRRVNAIEVHQDEIEQRQ